MSKIVTTIHRAREWIDETVVTKRKHLLGTCLVAASVVGLIGWSLFQLGERSRAGDERDAAISTYQVELDAYRTAVTQYESCLTRIETRALYRDRFLAVALADSRMVDVLAVASGTPESSPFLIELRSLVADEIADLDENLPLLGRDICPPTPPVRPEFNLDFGRTPTASEMQP